jgi:branched-chain amino acid transport system substrate-binding protein
LLRTRWLVSLSCLLAALAAGNAACDDDDGDAGGGGGGGGAGETVTVYSSLPLQGASRPQTTAMVQAMRLALQENNGKAGELTVNYTSLDASTARAATWTPEATVANVGKVADDNSAVAYIGEFSSGASAISIPLLNDVPIAQISPTNTAVGLTSDEPGAGAGEPEKYYPSGERHYLRIVPNDTVQGAALATLMKDDGCGNTYILHDKGVYGAGLARSIERASDEVGLEVLGNVGIDAKAPNFRSQALAMQAEGTECFVYSGITANGAVQLFADVAATLPDAKLYGPDRVADAAFADPAEGGLPVDVASRVKMTVAALAPGEFPPEGQRFFEDYEAEYGQPRTEPYGIYAYEAMRLFLDTCEELGPECTDRYAVIDALFDTKDRESVLGTYDIDENGDTTLTDYGVYTIEGSDLRFDQSIQTDGG